MTRDQESAFSRWVQGAESPHWVRHCPDHVLAELSKAFAAGWSARERAEAAEGVQQPMFADGGAS